MERIRLRPAESTRDGAQPGKVLFVVNRSKQGAQKLVDELAAVVRSNGFDCGIYFQYPLPESALDGVGLCVVVGGDGTLLGVVEACSACRVPAMGVNLGRLGFMASFAPEEALDHMAGILQTGAPYRDLSLLSHRRGDDPERLALNDVVIKTPGSRLIRLEVHCEAEHINTYHADGLIFSTPTGSTAYNLSAGGPIVHPGARVMVVTPINPHTLSNRAIVLDDAHSLHVQQTGGELQLVQVSADGQLLHEGRLARPIEISLKQNRTFRLLQPEQYSHYFVLRNKLGWSGDAVFS